jgi:tRNA(Arg) A34 adenosine deaminase TadA
MPAVRLSRGNERHHEQVLGKLEGLPGVHPQSLCVRVFASSAPSPPVRVPVQIYVALFPCNDCTKLIIQSGIREVVYLSDKYHDTPSCTAARRMLDLAKARAGVRLHVC